MAAEVKIEPDSSKANSPSRDAKRVESRRRMRQRVPDATTLGAVETILCGLVPSLSRARTKSFFRKQVVQAAQSLVALKVDITHTNPPVAQRLAKQYQIAALPVVMFFGSDRKERVGLRVVGYERADPFIIRMRAVD